MKIIAKGYVTDVGRKYFWARMTIDGDTIDVKAPIARLPLREKPLLASGAFLYLLKRGTFRFVRFQPMTKREIERGKSEAKELMRIWEKALKEAKRFA